MTTFDAPVGNKPFENIFSFSHKVFTLRKMNFLFWVKFKFVCKYFQFEHG